MFRCPGAPLAAIAALLLAHSPSSAVPTDRSAWVIGANDASVTRVDLDDGTVTPNVAHVGSLANRIEADPSGTFAIVVCSGSDDVRVLEFDTGQVTKTIALPPGSNPWDVEIIGERLFVTSLLGDRVDVVDLDAGTLVAQIPVGRAPQGMCTAGGKLWVANTGFDFVTFDWLPGSVSAIDVTALAVEATIPVSLNPQECVAEADGRVHVVCTGDFGATQGTVDVLDPLAEVVVASLAVPGYPGTGAARSSLDVGAPLVFVGNTTPTFGSEVLAYDPTTLSWVHGPEAPLLPSFDFYGNPATTQLGELLVPDFSADLLLLERPEAPGSPSAWIVGDGCVDVCVVEREEPIGLALSGLSASEEDEGIRLSWTVTREMGVAFVSVSRDAGAGPTVLARRLAPERRGEWLDADAPFGRACTYRVDAWGPAGDFRGSGSVLVVRRDLSSARLALRRLAPNPSREAVRIKWVAPREGTARLEVMDVAGRRLLTRELGRVGRGAGSFVWDGRDARGERVAPGMLLVRLVVDGESATERLLRLR